MNYSFFFSNDPEAPCTHTLSLHDALPIYLDPHPVQLGDLLPQGHARHQVGDALRDGGRRVPPRRGGDAAVEGDRKSTRLNSSHRTISYAVFCLKKKILAQLDKLLLFDLSP